MAKHIIFFNTKGGVGKSTLCEYTARTLADLGHVVSVDNTDQQVHVTLIQNDDAEFCIYDTAGAFTSANVDLLAAASSVDSLIIIPIKTGKNDFKELNFLVQKLQGLNLTDKTRFVFTNTRSNSKALAARRDELAALNLNSVDWFMPSLEDFSEQRNTKRTRIEMNVFLSEVIL